MKRQRLFCPDCGRRGVRRSEAVGRLRGGADVFICRHCAWYAWCVASPPVVVDDPFDVRERARLQAVNPGRGL